MIREGKEEGKAEVDLYAICMYMYVCMYVCMYVGMYVCMYGGMEVWRYACRLR